jgi:hypothetical protein
MSLNAESCYAECRLRCVSFVLSVAYAECRKQAHYAKCHYAECRHAECRYAECHCAECRGTQKISDFLSLF